jgi:hypothetical protein
MVNLPGERRQWLSWKDGYVMAQEPKEELVAAMFALASRLDAGVYSARAKPYASVGDWRKRTAPYRARRDAARDEFRSATRGRWLRWLAVMAAGATIGACNSYLVPYFCR